MPGQRLKKTASRADGGGGLLMERKEKKHRKTAETDVSVQWNLDGSGQGDIDTTVPFLDHMLHLLAAHGRFDITVRAQGDTDVDYHHLVEDLGITLGQVLDKALGDKKGIRRYGSSLVPMDESLAGVAVDLSGRPFLVFPDTFENMRIRDFDLGLFRDFFRAFVDQGRITLHVHVLYGSNSHHMIEAVFKALARALREAVARDPGVSGVPSTKGRL